MLNHDRAPFCATAPTSGAFAVTTFGDSPRPAWLDDERMAQWALHDAGWPRGWKAARPAGRVPNRPDALLSADVIHAALTLPEVDGHPLDTPVFAWTHDDGVVRSLGFGAFRLSWNRRRGVLQCMGFVNQGWRPADPIQGLDPLFDAAMLSAGTPDVTFLRAAALSNDTFQHAPWDWCARMHVVPLREFAMVVPREVGVTGLAEHVQGTLQAQGFTEAVRARQAWLMRQLRTWRREEPVLRRWFAWNRDASSCDVSWPAQMTMLQRPAVLNAWYKDVGHRARWAHFSATVLLAGDDPNAFSAAYWLRDDNGFQWWPAAHQFQWSASRTLRWSRTASPAVVRALSSRRALTHGAGLDFLWQRLHLMALADLFAHAGVTHTPLGAARLAAGLRMETVFLAWTHLNPGWCEALRASDVFPLLRTSGTFPTPHNARVASFRTVLETCETADEALCEGLCRALVAWLAGARDRACEWASGWLHRADQVWERLSDPIYQANFPWDKVQPSWRWETFQDRVEQGFADDADRFWAHDVGYDARPDEAVWGSALGMVTWDGITVVPVCREGRLQREGERFLNCLRDGDTHDDQVAMALAHQRRFFRLEQNGLYALLELRRETPRERWTIGQLKGVANRTATAPFDGVAQRVLMVYNLLDGQGSPSLDTLIPPDSLALPDSTDADDRKTLPARPFDTGSTSWPSGSSDVIGALRNSVDER